MTNEEMLKIQEERRLNRKLNKDNFPKNVMYNGKKVTILNVEPTYIVDGVLTTLDEYRLKSKTGKYTFVDNEYNFCNRISEIRLDNEKIKSNLREKRDELLNAFDIYKANVNYGVIVESDEQRENILNWYQGILDLKEEAFENIPQAIKYYM